jgi:hypothetical protein
MIFSVSDGELDNSSQVNLTPVETAEDLRVLRVIHTAVVAVASALGVGDGIGYTLPREALSRSSHQQFGYNHRADIRAPVADCCKRVLVRSRVRAVPSRVEPLAKQRLVVVARLGSVLQQRLEVLTHGQR